MSNDNEEEKKQPLEFFMWVCPDCGMKNYEIVDVHPILMCRAGDCGHEFPTETIEKVVEEDEE